jgi:hypothetical protein
VGAWGWRRERRDDFGRVSCMNASVVTNAELPTRFLGRDRDPFRSC